MSGTSSLPFGGGELSSFDPLSTTGCIEQSSGTPGVNYDPNFARCAIHISPGFYATSPVWAAAATGWFHGALTWGGSGITNARALSFYQSGTEVFRMQTSSSGPSNYVWNYQTLQSGVLTSVGSFTLPANNAPATFDIKIVAGANGGLQVYSSGTLVVNVPTGLNHGGFTGVDQIQITGIGVPFNGGDAFWSEVIFDSVPHIGDRLRTFPINTLSGTNFGWTGAVTDVNEVILNDATFCSAATANLTDTFFASGFSLGTFNIVSVIVAIRVNCGVTGPQNVNLALRTASTNFFSPNLACANGYQATVWSWNTNPNTLSQWLAADAQAVEGGMRSQA